MKQITLLLALALLFALAAACSLPQTPPGVGAGLSSCAQTVAAVAGSQAFAEMTALSDNQILSDLLLNDGLLADMAMSVDASLATAECIVAVSGMDEASADMAYQALASYRDAALAACLKNQPEEAPKLEAAILERKGLQSVLVVCKDARAARKALSAIGW